MQLSALTLALGRFVSELQRRKVIRVGAGYAVVGWIVLQVALALQTAMKLPDSLSTGVVALLILGFPIALVLAWLFEFTPDGIKRTTTASGEGALVKPQTTDVILAGMLALVVVVALAQALAPRATTTTAQSDKPKVETAALGDKSIAVLPFANLSPDKANEYFADGLTEELLNLLAKVGDMKVISRTSSFAFKGKNASVPEIAKQLGVRHILEGTVRASGNDLRVSAQLIDTASDTHLWSHTYERPVAEVFAVQDDIARAIAEALKVEVTLVSRAENPPTRDLQAYRLYLEALNLYRNRDAPSSAQAIDRLKAAIARDRNFAEAHATLAISYSASVPPQMPLDLAKKWTAHALNSATAAIKLKPNLSLPYSVLAIVARRQGEWAKAMGYAEKAVSLGPSDPMSRLTLALIQCNVGQIETCANTLARVEEIDPLYTRVRLYMLAVDIARGDDDAVKRAAQQLIDSSRPNSINAAVGNFCLAVQAYDRGDAAAAEIYYTRSLPAPLQGAPAIVAVIKALHSPAARDAAVHSLSADNSDPNKYIALVESYSLLKAHDAMIEYMQARLSQGYTFGTDPWSMIALWGPRYKDLRQMRSFKALLQRGGLVDYWRSHGWPDRCRAKGEDDFECS